MQVKKILVLEIVNMKPQLGMIFAPYCYEESKLSDGEDDNDACVTAIIVVTRND